MKNSAFDHFLKLWISLARNVKCWKEITDQTHEHRQVIGDDLRDVEVSQSAHQHLSTPSSKQLGLVHNKRAIPGRHSW